MTNVVRFRGFLQLFLALYVLYSVLLTTKNLVLPQAHVRSVRPRVWPTFDLASHQQPLRFNRWSDNANSLPGSSSELSEQHFLSKAFSHSLQPGKLVPYYYRASGHFDPEDITLTTLITNNRFEVFSQLVHRYQGPISVTVHIKNGTEDTAESLKRLEEMYALSPLMARYVDVHLVLDSFDRQFNMWRNVARFFARTDFVTMLDVDFVPCTDFRGTIRKNEAARRLLAEGQTALVIPAFEFLDYTEGKDSSNFPKNKENLIELVNARRVGMFHASWPAGHNGTDYDRFYSSGPGELYPVTLYQPAYEPYVIFKKQGSPWCDERFVGYGGNKAACLFEMYVSGVSFQVLSDDFLIHQHHRYEETVRRPERKYNRKVFSDFKEETCLRYLRSFHDSGLLESAKADNARRECAKIKSVSRAARELFGITLE